MCRPTLLSAHIDASTRVSLSLSLCWSCCVHSSPFCAALPHPGCPAGLMRLSLFRCSDTTRTQKSASVSARLHACARRRPCQGVCCCLVFSCALPKCALAHTHTGCVCFGGEHLCCCTNQSVLCSPAMADAALNRKVLPCDAAAAATLPIRKHTCTHTGMPLETAAQQHMMRLLLLPVTTALPSRHPSARAAAVLPAAMMVRPTPRARWHHTCMHLPWRCLVSSPAILHVTALLFKGLGLVG